MKVNDIIAHALKAEGVKLVTGFPFNQVLDGVSALGIRPIMARTERVAVNMADGYSRMSAGKTFGVSLVQYGPGIENAAGAIAQAYADASSVLVIPGAYDSREHQVSPNYQAREHLRFITKEVLTVNHPERAALMLHRASGLLRSGKPGPVVVEVPDELMLKDVPFDPESYRPVRISPARAPDDEIERLIAAIRKAKSPLIMAGKGILNSASWSELRELAELMQVPVMTTLAGKSSFPEDHPLALGTGGLSRTAMVDHFLAKADLVIGLGTSFTRSHYTTQMPPGRRMIQVTNDPSDVSKSWPLEAVIIGDLSEVLRQLIAAARDGAPKQGYAGSALAREIAKVKKAFLAEWAPRLNAESEPISPYRVIAELMRAADRTKTVVTHDSGNPRDQIVPFYETITAQGYIGWGRSTQLGTGLGLIMGAKLAKPDWLAVNIMGDAAIGMVGMDLETAVRCEIPIMTVVFNNGRMGGYTEHHPIATAKHAVDMQTGRYGELARALGAEGERVEKVRDLAPALARAIKSTKDGRPALVEVITREEPVFPIGS